MVNSIGDYDCFFAAGRRQKVNFVYWASRINGSPVTHFANKSVLCASARFYFGRVPTIVCRYRENAEPSRKTAAAEPVESASR